MNIRRRRVLLGQLAANGDCVFATTIARQIKEDDPACHLTWAIGAEYRQVIQNNPHVDDVWEVPAAGRATLIPTWRSFAAEAQARQRRGDFDEIHLTQVFPDNFRNFDGTVRASIFNGYPGAITVPVTPVIRLSDAEVRRVELFAAQHGLDKRGPIVFVESSAHSGQSFMTPAWALETCSRLASQLPDVRVVLNALPPEATGEPRIIDGSVLGFREVAEFMRYCSLFMGCSSGLTWVCTSDAAKRIPMIQLLSSRARMYGAVVHDLEHWGLPSDHVIEMRDVSSTRAAQCAVEVLTGGVGPARRRYHQGVQIRFDQYYSIMLPFIRGSPSTLLKSMRQTVARYGLRPELMSDLLSEAATTIRRRVQRRVPWL